MTDQLTALKELVESGDIYELLYLSEITGNLFWKKRPIRFFVDASKQKAWNTQNAGKMAGCVGPDGYLAISLMNKSYRAHILVYTMHNGKVPDGPIDHDNGDKLDNRPKNINVVTHLENMRNMSRAKNNTSGITGVSWYKNKNKWSARIQVKGKQIALGYYDDLDEASEVRKAAEKKYGFHQNHGRAIIKAKIQELENDPT